MTVTELFDNIWQQYISVTPSAHKVHQLLSNGEPIINDHVAFRTFNLPKVNLDKLAAHLIKLGYRECGEYHFEAKKLYAKHFEHEDKTLPKVFISELLVEQLSETAQKIIHHLVEQLDESIVAAENFLYSGTNWQISYQDYQTLLAESEYAAWLAAWGYRANHFTVSINHLKDYDNIAQVNETLKNSGFSLNAVGGEIKGNQDVKLEQSSTLADKFAVKFTDKTVEIPSCFYEFAQRYPLDNGELYSGFVAASADKIFESTNVKVS
jgi:phosphoglycolate phosphatase-like HAD superfamily hydrolase